MLALTGAGASPTYRAVYSVTGPGSGPVRTVVVAQRPPLAAYTSGGSTVFTTVTASGGSGPAAEVVARSVVLGILEQDAQAIEEGDPGDELRTVTRTHDVVVGQQSTCLRVATSGADQVVCLTLSGIPTLVSAAGTTATLESLTGDVPVRDVVPPAASASG